RRRRGDGPRRVLGGGRAPRGPDAHARRRAEPRIEASAVPDAPREAEVAVAQFLCRMALPTGEIVERTMIADSEAALRRELEERDVLPRDPRRATPRAWAFSAAMAVRSGIAAREFLFFTQEFPALLRAGLPTLASLDILIDRRKNQVFKKALVDI